MRIASTGLSSIIVDVLVGGGVEDDAGRCSLSTSRIRSSSLQSASTGHGDPHVTVLLELAHDLEQVVLGVVDEHQLARPDTAI